MPATTIFPEINDLHILKRITYYLNNTHFDVRILKYLFTKLVAVENIQYGMSRNE